MICQRCGTKYDDNAAACPVCSQPSSQYVYTSPQQSPAPQTAEAAYYNYGQEFSETKYNKRKRRKKATSVIIAVSAAAVLAAVFLLNFNVIVGFCIKTFASPDVYFAYVEKRAGSTDALLDGYADIIENKLTETGTEGKISLNLGEKVKKDIGGDDYSWLDDFYLSASSSADGDLNKTELQAFAGDTMLLGVQLYVNGESGDMILGLPGLTDKYVSGIANKNGTLTTGELSEILPSEKEMKSISSRYLKIVKEHSGGIRRATEDFVIDGVEQKLSMLELNFGRSDMIDLIHSIATELKSDEQVLVIFDRLTQKLKEKDAIEPDADFRKDFIDELDELLQTLDDARTDVEINIPTFRYRDFVTMSHDIVGKEITVDGKNVLYFVNVRDGKEIGSEIRIGSVVDMIGYGKKEDGKITVDYVMTNNGAQLGTASVTDLEINKKEKTVSGKIKILPTARLIYDLKLPTWLAKMGAGLDLSFDVGSEDVSLTANLLSDEKLYLGISTYTTVSEKEEITLPTEKVFNGENEAQEFFGSLDFKALEQKMKNAGLPDGIIQLTQYLQLIQEFGI